jgi:phosphoribosylamine---glycine ligase
VRVLVVGSGGREHALAWKIAQSRLVSDVYAAPGNPGIAADATCVDIAVADGDALVGFAASRSIDLTVIGPEVPLVAGLADRFADKGLLVFGPRAAAAAIEGSKVFAKTLMARHGIPTARFETFDDPDRARRYCRTLGAPVVVKADGLAAGKGVLVCRTLADADAALAQCMEERAFGAAGATVIVEEFLHGEEASFFALVSGEHAVPWAVAQDHKTVFDGDMGPNTGGMGAYTPVAAMDVDMQARIMRTIVDPTVRALAGAGAPYFGVLYAGLMLTAEGPKVIEFNCRFGDPECQPIMAASRADLVPALLAVARGERPPAAEPSQQAAVCVTLASGGYPGRYVTGLPITGVEAAGALPGVRVFHSGTARREGTLVTDGGRVLGVTAVAADVPRAIHAAYEGVSRIHFDGMHFRTDIGRRAARPA